MNNYSSYETVNTGTGKELTIKELAELVAKVVENVMNIVLLSGGSGKRLWPLSNDIRSKQFIKIFKTEDGGYESMLQRVCRQIKQVDLGANVTIATSKAQVSAIRNQLGENVGISVEPCRRDTFPAIALVVEYLYDVRGITEEEPVVICPVDPYVEDDYFEAIEELGRQAAKGEANLVLMGIRPTKISFDYAVVENEKKIQVMRYEGQWKDLGTWNTLTEAMEEHSVGRAIIGNTCQNVHVINELNVPILTMGLADMVISASPEGILVSDKNQSSYIKPYVDEISQQVMFAEKSWGSFRVLDVENESLTIKVTLNPGCRHTVIADTRLELIEVQLGKEISVDDKQKYPLDE